MGNYSSTPTVGENAGGDDTRPSFYGITPSGELLDRGVVFDSDLDVTLQNAFEKGKADGISSVQEMIVSLAEGERKKLQDSMVELNLKHKESAKELVSLTLFCNQFGSRGSENRQESCFCHLSCDFS